MRTLLSASLTLFILLSSCPQPGGRDTETSSSGESTALVTTMMSTSTTTGTDSTSATSPTSTTVTTTGSSGSSGPSGSETTSPVVCEEDDKCDVDKGEDVDNCPADCSICGDGEKTGNEPCDNGINTDDPYSMTEPAKEACAPGCIAVEWCGDGIMNGMELCDTMVQSKLCEANCQLPACGDGIPNNQAGEHCDDKNTDILDGCDKCLRVRIVFVATTPENQPPGTFVTLAGADSICDTYAQAAIDPITKLPKLPNASDRTFRAWLSDGVDGPITRFKAIQGNYIDILKNPVATDRAQLFSEMLSGPVKARINPDNNVAELGNQPNILTHTLATGATELGKPCSIAMGSAWSDQTVDMQKAGFGKANKLADKTWTDNGDPLDVDCAGPYNIYCFEDEPD